MKKNLSFPLPRPHTGFPLANGRQGLLVWGGGRVLNISIGRLGFWDRRGGNPFLNRATFQEVRHLVERGDEAGLFNCFGRDGETEGALRPHQIGGGRLELHLESPWELQEGILDRSQGILRVRVRKGNESGEIVVRMAVDAELGWLTLSPHVPLETVCLRPAWEWIGEEMAKTGCEPPKRWHEQDEQGFVQSLPGDDPLAVVLRRVEDCQWAWSTRVGAEAETEARNILRCPLQDAEVAANSWWDAYWQAVPRLCLPDPELQEIAEQGLYLQACCTPPQGLPCTLQGPLMEETRLPPWSNDYHLNINLQMIYTPAMATNCLRHFDPLWAMLKQWLPGLRRSGEAFFGDSDALMLPHAVDDRCQVVGAFWTGAIDHACTAWMGMMCWDVCRYGRDEKLLRELAWPLLRGAFAGYWAMAERDGQGRLNLPVSVSPEFKGCRMDAWGRNASFQLAACHAVLRALPQAAEWLGEESDPRWAEMALALPPVCTVERSASVESPETRTSRIALWQNQDLEASHRHHSHLACVTPFKTLDPQSNANQPLLRESIRNWQYRGAGAWSGWSVPWASSIHTHCGEPDAAIFWLRYWRQLYTNEGGASLHDAAFPGVSNLDGSSAYWSDNAEVMQLDGQFGALTAVLDLLVQEYDGLIRVLPRLPRDWRTLSFSGILAPGGFLVGAEVTDRVGKVRVHSRNGGVLRLQIGAERLPDQQTEPGQELVFPIQSCLETSSA